MMAFLQQVFSLLTTNPGSLAYHLVLAFSLVAALLAVGYAWSTASTPVMKSAGWRMFFGLGLLLALRALLFGVAALAWQQVIDVAVLLPALERGVDVLSLLVIVWLWAFPLPNLLGDGLSAFFGLLLAALILLGLGFTVEQGPLTSFNGSLNDGLAQMLSLGLCVGGGLLLLLRRPPGWSMGLIMLILLGAGHLWQLFYPLLGNFPGSVRLAQMAAFPFLIALPYRFTSQTTQALNPSRQGEKLVITRSQQVNTTDETRSRVVGAAETSLESDQQSAQVAELQNALLISQQELESARERARKAEQDRANLSELVSLLQEPSAEGIAQAGEAVMISQTDASIGEEHE